MLQSKLRKIGNSLGAIQPKEVTTRSNIEEGNIGANEAWNLSTTLRSVLYARRMLGAYLSAIPVRPLTGVAKSGGAVDISHARAIPYRPASNFCDRQPHFFGEEARSLQPRIEKNLDRLFCS